MIDRTRGITVKLYKGGMIIFINSAMDYGQLSELVKEKFAASASFFKGAVPKVGFKGHEITLYEKNKLIELISNVLHTEVTLWENPEDLVETTEEKIKRSISVDAVLSKAIDVEADDEYTKFYKKTLRSGQFIRSKGNVVIVGDVNPGAEVIADGNIFIMGSVKGIVHAGASGNREAVIVALNLVPTQLRIADIITRSPDEKIKLNYQPEVAYINDGRIFIEDFLQKRK